MLDRLRGMERYYIVDRPVRGVKETEGEEYTTPALFMRHSLVNTRSGRGSESGEEKRTEDASRYKRQDNGIQSNS